MSKVLVQPGQCLLDVAVQHLGGAGALFALARANGLHHTTDLVAGQSLTLPAVLDKRTAKYFRDGGYVPAVGEFATGSGIDFWGIEYDFVVSGEPDIVPPPDN